MAASEAMEATEVKNNLKNGLSDLKYMWKDTHIVLIFKFYMVASEAIEAAEGKKNIRHIFLT